MKEFRTMTIAPSELEKDGSGEMIVEGYAAVFGARTLIGEDPDGSRYFEVIDSQAFTGADFSRTVFKYNHGDSGLVLARTANSTLDLSIDERGLKVRAKIADTSLGRDLYTLIKRGDLNKMSFAFTVAEDSIEHNVLNREYLRIIKRFGTIYDVSVVDFPAYDDTSIEARSSGIDCFARFKQAELEKRRRLLLMSMC